MKKIFSFALGFLVLVVLLGLWWVMATPISALVVDPQRYAVEVHWKGSDGAVLGNLSKLREYIKNSNRGGRERTLIMGMNAGMYLQSPMGNPIRAYIGSERENQ